MTRARFGLTGLAFVFLLVLSAAALFGRRDVQSESAAPSSGDTMAELGVAPPSEPPPRATVEPNEPPPQIIPAPGAEPYLGEDLDTIPLPKVRVETDSEDDLTEI